MTTPTGALVRVLGQEQAARTLGLTMQEVAEGVADHALLPPAAQARAEYVADLLEVALAGGRSLAWAAYWLYQPQASCGGRVPVTLLMGAWDPQDVTSRALMRALRADVQHGVVAD